MYFYGHKDVLELLDKPSVVQGESAKLVTYQKRKGRLVWTSLENYNPQKADNFKTWLKSNIANIADFCFSRGLAKCESEWAHYVWYKNALGESMFDEIYKIDDIKNVVQQNAEIILQSKINGGSTIRLPFGFVQWHQEQMQFHHLLKLLQALFK